DEKTNSACICGGSGDTIAGDSSCACCGSFGDKGNKVCIHDDTIAGGGNGDDEDTDICVRGDISNCSCK
ncbi:23683_t:CDS:1, partial [Racocetra persica]